MSFCLFLRLACYFVGSRPTRLQYAGFALRPSPARTVYGPSEESNMRLLRSLLAAALLAHALACPAQQPAPGQAVATFGGGCFWCMEPPCDALPGVISTTSGYMGGTKRNPSYEAVASGTTGHAEGVPVACAAQPVSYEATLEVFGK